MQRREHIASGRDDSIAKCFQVSLQVGERCAQFVSGVLDELLAQPLLLLKLECELVEGPRQRLNLPRTGLAQPQIVLTGSKPRRGVGDPHDRSRYPPRERRGEKQSGPDRSCNRPQQNQGDTALKHVPRRGHAGAVLDHKLLELRATHSLHADGDNGER